MQGVRFRRNSLSSGKKKPDQPSKEAVSGGPWHAPEVEFRVPFEEEALNVFIMLVDLISSL